MLRSPDGEALAQGAVVGVLEEAFAEGADGFFDAVAEAVEHADAALFGLGGPAFEPAGLGWGALDAGLVAEEPEELEVGILAAFEHGEEVELDVGLAGEGDVVAQDAEVEAVGDEGPEVVIGAVEELLHHGVRAFLGGALGSGGALVDADACAEEVDGGRRASGG